MSFANDKLYNGYLRRNMPTIVSKVKVKEIIVHLPCLTMHDREHIEAKRENNGNFDGMVLLLDCLKRRENWPEQFIEALEACEHSVIAAEIRAEYDALRGVTRSNQSSPSTTVTRAHVHPAPSASDLPIPESTSAAVAPLSEAPAPPKPPAQTPLPLETPVHPQVQSSATPQPTFPEAASQPEPTPEPLQSFQMEVAPPPSTPPPSPETPHTPANTPLRDAHTHQEPVETSESDLQGNDVIPDQAWDGKTKVSVVSAVTPPPSRHAGQGETDAESNADPPQTTSATELRPPQSPSPTQADTAVTDVSAFPTLTPERPPVQDTTPPVDKTPAVVLEPEETPEPPTTQVVESSPQTETAATTSLPDKNRMHPSAVDDSTFCLSKPDQLVSVQPQDHDSPTIPAHDAPVEPYSGDSERLQISEAAQDAAPACSALCSTTIQPSERPLQENGIALNHNEPEENHYDSLSQSLEMQEVLVNVVHVSEESSILNLGGQISAPQDEMINGQASGKPPSCPQSSTAAYTVSAGVNTPSNESSHPSEPALPEITPGKKTLQDSKEKKTPCTLSTNARYLVTAAGVGAFALLLALKFKKLGDL